MRSPAKRSQAGDHGRASPRPASKPSLAKRLREVDQAVERGDHEALLQIAERSLEEITYTVQEMVADQRRSLKAMVKIEKRIDRNQAATARVLDRLISGH